VKVEETAFLTVLQVVGTLLAGRRVVRSTTLVHLAEALSALTDHAFIDVVTGSFKLRETGDKGCLIMTLLTLLLSKWLGWTIWFN